MDFFEVVEQRRSLRKFSDRTVERSAIEKIIDAAELAPSSRNSRSTRFLVVTDRLLIDHIALMRDYGSSFLRGAPAVVLVMGDVQISDLWLDNAAIAATYIQLAAEASGLGSCWVHVNGREHQQGKPQMGLAEEYLRTFLPIPAECRVLCAIALGYSPYDKPRERPAGAKEPVEWI